MSQLTAVLYPDETGTIYTYDAVGNRLTENDVTYSYDAANQLVQVGEAIYTYDVNGNLLSDGEKTYQYDHDNRLISLTEGETTTTYTYDGDGNRLSQSIQAGEEARTHEYIYDINKGLPELIVEIEGEKEYIYIYAGRVITQVSDDGRAYYHQDGLGSIVLITDEDGEELNRYEYDAFGTPDKLLETIHNPLLFTGEPYDENGLIFLRARYYDPATGRFLTRDTYLGTLDDPLSQHLYIYVANNPVLYVDPSGHLKICSWDKIFSGTGSTILGGIAIGIGITAFGIVTGGAGFALVPALIAGGTTAGGVGMVAYGSLDIREGITGKNEVRDFIGDELYYGGYTLSGFASVVGGSYSLTYSQMYGYRVVDTPKPGSTAAKDTGKVEFKGKTVNKDNSSFDPKALDKQGRSNVQRMEKGLAPIGHDGKPVNIHHIDQTNTGPVIEMPATGHQQNYGTLHQNTGQLLSLINRSEFNVWRNDYWKWRANDFK